MAHLILPDGLIFLIPLGITIQLHLLRHKHVKKRGGCAEKSLFWVIYLSQNIFYHTFSDASRMLKRKVFEEMFHMAKSIDFEFNHLPLPPGANMS
jgi:hypothetical protein